MPETINIDRRTFLKTSSAVGGGLVLGFSLFGCGSKYDAKTLIKNSAVGKDQMATTFIPNMWLRINSDGTVVIQSASSEMGQGVMTAIPMLVAEELEIELSQVSVEFAPAHSDYANPQSGFQITGGSNSIRGFWQPLREAGATARELLIAAGATIWSVDKIECYAKNGKVIHIPTNKAMHYGELSARASLMTIPKRITLKDSSRYKLIGKAQPRLDIPAKTDGSAVFGIDVKLPGLLTACVARSPQLGAKLKNFDATKAKQVPGVREVIRIDSGVAVVADHFWAAKQGRDALHVEWEQSEFSTLSSDKIRQQFKLGINDNKSVRDDGNADNVLANAKRKISASFETPYLAHACMEPMNCTARVQEYRCDIWAPTQSQEFAQAAGKEITGLSIDNVWVHTTFLGGGFGRRAEKDFVIDAVQCSKAVNAPVKVIWTREDDIKHDYYRPATYNELSAAVNDDGEAVAWQHNMAGQSILQRFIPLAKLVLRGKDDTSTEGAKNIPYAIPNIAVNYAWMETAVPVGFWRSVGNSQNGFVTECFMDELATLADQDPFKFRQSLLKDQPRHLRVLELAAEKAQWGRDLEEGHYHGIAMVASFGSYVAQVAEISLQSNAAQPIKVHRVICAVDCGTVINPNTVKAQIQGAIIYGLSAALYGEINIDGGRINQNNFNDYPCLRINEAPQIEVHIIDSEDPPGGVGEIGVPPIAPAVANAIYAATGKRIRKLPMKLDELVNIVNDTSKDT